MKQLMFSKGCVSGKTTYQSRDHAEGAADRWFNKVRVSLRVYLCPDCKMYHLTKLNAPKRK